MTRIKLLSLEEMNAEQRAVYDQTVAGRRGWVPEPVVAWLRSPELASRAQKLGEFVRYETSLPPRLSELAILVVARQWTCQYEWFAHKPDALKGGLGAGIIDAIAHRQPPQFEQRDESLVYGFSVALTKTCMVPGDLYRETVESIGERGAVELVGLLGYYTLVAMTLNTFEIGLPEGVEPGLPA